MPRLLSFGAVYLAFLGLSPGTNGVLKNGLPGLNMSSQKPMQSCLVVLQFRFVAVNAAALSLKRLPWRERSV